MYCAYFILTYNDCKVIVERPIPHKHDLPIQATKISTKI